MQPIKHVFMLKSDSIRQADGSVLCVAHDWGWGTYTTNRFGDIAVGTRGVSRIVVRVFGRSEAVKHSDAIVRVEFDDARPAKGFSCVVADVGRRCQMFLDRKIKGLAADGGCPVCLESDVCLMAPIQGLACGHGMCVRCLVKWDAHAHDAHDYDHDHDHAHAHDHMPPCPTCRKPGQINDAFAEVLSRSHGVRDMDMRGIAARMGYKAVGLFYKLGFYRWEKCSKTPSCV